MLSQISLLELMNHHINSNNLVLYYQIDINNDTGQLTQIGNLKSNLIFLTFDNSFFNNTKLFKLFLKIKNFHQEFVEARILR